MGAGGVCHYCAQWTCICGTELERKAVVVLNCNKQYHHVKDVEFVNIHSNIHEEDVLTYTCPVCGEQEESLILG